MSEGGVKYLFTLQHLNPDYDSMPFSIAKTWLDDRGLDIAFYLMYDAVQLVKKEAIAGRPEIKELVDDLLGKGVKIYTCGFCSRVCDLNTEKYYPGIEVANRHIYYALMTERQVVYY